MRIPAPGVAPASQGRGTRYEEAANDLRTYYETTQARDLTDVDKRLKHLQGFFARY